MAAKLKMIRTHQGTANTKISRRAIMNLGADFAKVSMAMGWRSQSALTNLLTRGRVKRTKANQLVKAFGFALGRDVSLEELQGRKPAK